MKNVHKLILSIFGCEAVGIIGSVFTVSAIEGWYAFLNKPFFSPPNWLFGPVWTLLYFLMGISLYLIWDKKKNKQAVTYFFIQLFLNFLWSILFFGLHAPLLGLVNIIAMIVYISLTMKASYPISKNASYLLVPYLVWVCFATILNLAIVLLN